MKVVHKKISNKKDSLRMLVSTDNHLGFKEKDKIRHNDSFEGIEEVLEIARKEKVDLVLLGGDLFDQSHPS